MVSETMLLRFGESIDITNMLTLDISSKDTENRRDDAVKRAEVSIPILFIVTIIYDRNGDFENEKRRCLEKEHKHKILLDNEILKVGHRLNQ